MTPRRALGIRGGMKDANVIRIAIVTLLALALSACGGNGRLHRLDAGATGPDEFSVIPMRPLAMPDALTLPAPTPGGVNLADPNPRGAAMAALGGADGAGHAGDAALMAQVMRHGSDPAIRATLAQEDADFRRRAAALGGFNFLGRDRYFQAYARMALDAWAELTRFRAAGIATPSAPPQ